MYICTIKLMKFSMLFIITLSVILGIDSFVTCLSVGICNTNITRAKAFTLFASIGLFHFIMPLLGSLPITACPSISFGNSHYFSAFVFFLLALKMIYEGVKPLLGKDDLCCNSTVLNLSLIKILLLSFIISIDAVVAGFSISIIDTGVSFIVIPISFAIASFIMSLIGFYSGKLLSRYFKDYANIFGGLILFLLALKIALS